MGSLISLIMAILNAIPILDKWFQDLQVAYVKKKVEDNDVEFLEALKKAHEQKSTKDLQHSIGKLLD